VPKKPAKNVWISNFFEKRNNSQFGWHFFDWIIFSQTPQKETWKVNFQKQRHHIFFRRLLSPELCYIMYNIYGDWMTKMVELNVNKISKSTAVVHTHTLGGWGSEGERLGIRYRRGPCLAPGRAHLKHTVTHRRMKRKKRSWKSTEKEEIGGFMDALLCVCVCGFGSLVCVGGRHGEKVNIGNTNRRR
jgi:hypothetical protein